MSRDPERIAARLQPPRPMDWRLVAACFGADFLGAVVCHALVLAILAVLP